MTTAKKVETWMPLLVDKYLGDTMHLSTDQHGAYLLLLLTMWKRGGKLPADDTQLANIAKMPPARWRANRKVLLAFFTNTDGFLTQKRLGQELLRAMQNVEQRSEAGKASAAARAKAAAQARSETEKRGNARSTVVATAVGTDDATGPATDVPTNPQREAQREAKPLPTPSLRSSQASPVEHAGKAKASKRCPGSFAVTKELVLWAKKNAPGIDVPRETIKFRNHTFRTARSDWPATWQNWILEAADRQAGRPAGTSMKSFREQSQDSAADTLSSMTGGLLGGQAERDRDTIEEGATHAHIGQDD